MERDTIQKEFRYKGYTINIDYSDHEECKGWVWTFHDAEMRSTDSVETCTSFKTREVAAKAAMKAVDDDIIRQEVESGDYKF